MHDNDIEINIEGKFVIAERIIRSLKNNIYKDMTAVSEMCTLIK